MQWAGGGGNRSGALRAFRFAVCTAKAKRSPGGAVSGPAKIPVKKEQTKNLPVLQMRTAYFVKQGDFYIGKSAVSCAVSTVLAASSSPKRSAALCASGKATLC